MTQEEQRHEKSEKSRSIFRLEKECLTSLNNNFECICDKPRTHFPKIIESDENNLELVLTHCGDDLASYLTPPCLTQGNCTQSCAELQFSDNIRLLAKRHQMDKQIECIIYNLKINKIVNFDIHVHNMCVSEDGNLSLIDFGHAATESEMVIVENDISMVCQISQGMLYKDRGKKNERWNMIEALKRIGSLVTSTFEEQEKEEGFFSKDS